MWKNIANQPRFIEKIIKHRAEIIPILEEKVKQDRAQTLKRRFYMDNFLR